jgi:hypothetical protein
MYCMTVHDTMRLWAGWSRVPAFHLSVHLGVSARLAALAACFKQRGGHRTPALIRTHLSRSSRSPRVHRHPTPSLPRPPHLGFVMRAAVAGLALATVVAAQRPSLSVNDAGARPSSWHFASRSPRPPLAALQSATAKALQNLMSYYVPNDMGVYSEVQTPYVDV